MRTSIVLLILSLNACLFTNVHAEETARMLVPSIAFNELFHASDGAGNGGDASSDERFRRAMLDDGILTVNNIPGFGSLRRRVLAGVSACGATAPSARVANFPDGTSRRTVAAVAKGFQPRDFIDLDFDASDMATCSKDLRVDVHAFRELVSSVSRAFVERLKESFPSKDGSPMLRLLTRMLTHSKTSTRWLPQAITSSTSTPTPAAIDHRRATTHLPARLLIYTPIKACSSCSLQASSWTSHKCHPRR